MLPSDHPTELFLAHLGTVDRCARVLRRWRVPRMTADDIYSECLVAVWRAAVTWRPDGAASFETYAAQACRRAVWRASRVERRRGLTGVGDRSAEERHDRTYRYPAFAPDLPDTTPAAVQPDRESTVNAVLDRLPRDKARILKLRYLDELSAPEVARLLGISRQRVYQVVDEAGRLLPNPNTGV